MAIQIQAEITVLYSNNKSIIYNPNNFTPKDYLPASLHKHCIKAQIFVHTILSLSAINNKDEADYIQINCKRMQSLIGWRYYTKIRDALIGFGVIECDGVWAKGKKNMGFRLTKKFRQKHINAIELKGVNAVKIKNIKPKVVVSSELEQYLYNWLVRVKVSDSYKDVVVEGRNCTRREISIEKLRLGQFRFNCFNAGRIHHNISSIYKKYRPHLTIDGKSMIELDIANSQPLLLSVLLLKYYKRESNITYNITTHIHYDTPFWGINKGIDYKPYKFIQDEVIANVPADVSAYIRLCENGEFYKFCQDLWKDTTDVGAFKTLLYTNVFYGSMAQWTLDNKYTKLFMETFPNVWAVIKHYKRHDYKKLSHRMQKIEANLMIKKVCLKLKEEHPEIPCLTIHDSIMTTPDNEMIVRGLIMDVFKKKGLRPTIKQK